MVLSDNPAWNKAALTATPSGLSGGEAELATAKGLALTAACAEAAAVLLLCKRWTLHTDRLLGQVLSGVHS